MFVYASSYSKVAVFAQKIVKFQLIVIVFEE